MSANTEGTCKQESEETELIKTMAQEPRGFPAPTLSLVSSVSGHSCNAVFSSLLFKQLSHYPDLICPLSNKDKRCGSGTLLFVSDMCFNKCSEDVGEVKAWNMNCNRTMQTVVTFHPRFYEAHWIIFRVRVHLSAATVLGSDWLSPWPQRLRWSYLGSECLTHCLK